MIIPFPHSTVMEQWSCEHYAWALDGEVFPYWRAYLGIDPVDFYWELIAQACVNDGFLQEENQQFVNKVKWLIENNISFAIQFDVDETVSSLPSIDEHDRDDYIFNQIVKYWLEIRDPDHAILFKLTWGSK